MIDFVIVAYQDRVAVSRLLEELDDTVRYPWAAHVVDNTLTNRGWAHACNRGAALGDWPLIGFLNPDIYLQDGWLEPIIAALDHDSTLAVAGPRCQDGLPWPRKGQGMRGWVCGAAMIVRRMVFTGLGGFDSDRFPHEYAETDFERSVEAAGLRVATIEESEVRHDFTPHKSTQVRAWNAIGAANEQTKWGLG